MSSNYSRQVFKQLQESIALTESLREELIQSRKESKKQIAKLENMLASAQEQICKKDEIIAKLLDRIEKMESDRNNNSNNSSLPPSTDQKGRKSANEYNSRKDSGKKKGGQKGHTGKTLTKKQIEEQIATGAIEPEVITEGVPEGQYISKYEVDLVYKAVIREHRFYRDASGKYNIPERYRSDVTYGPSLRALVVSLFTEGVVSVSRIHDLVNAMSEGEIEISEGTVYNIIRDASERTETEIEKIEERLMDSSVLCTDATVVTNNGKLAYIRNVSTGEYVLYQGFLSKKKSDIAERAIYRDYAGIFVNDHDTGIYDFGADHAECNAHILRYLRKNSEDTRHSWSDEMQKLLVEMKESKDHNELTDERIEIFEKRYDEILQDGRKANTELMHKSIQSDENSLLNRMEKYKHNHLLFMHFGNVPFDNNMSERDLRKCKNRQKMAGGFRSETGLEMYCRLMSFTETCKRHGKSVFKCISSLLGGVSPIFG